jgi:hypothetical protein
MYIDRNYVVVFNILVIKIKIFFRVYIKTKTELKRCYYIFLSNQ